MSLSLEQIEHSLDGLLGKAKAHKRKWMKNQRNRKIRRTNKEENLILNTKVMNTEL